jgi:very-short-patch-repair endonuclease
MRDPELLRRAREMRSNPTEPEARLWYHLRAKRFEATKFRFQTVIAPYIVDFTSRTKMLAIELDGETHAHQQSYDARRDRFLKAEGFRLLRFPNNEVMTNLEGVLHAIAEAIANSSPSPRLRGEGRGEGPIQTSGTP